jgi:hypothetical protein
MLKATSLIQSHLRDRTAFQHISFSGLHVIRFQQYKTVFSIMTVISFSASSLMILQLSRIGLINRCVPWSQHVLHLMDVQNVHSVRPLPSLNIFSYGLEIAVNVTLSSRNSFTNVTSFHIIWKQKCAHKLFSFSAFHELISHVELVTPLYFYCYRWKRAHIVYIHNTRTCTILQFHDGFLLGIFHLCATLVVLLFTVKIHYMLQPNWPSSGTLVLQCNCFFPWVLFRLVLCCSHARVQFHDLFSNFSVPACVRFRCIPLLHQIHPARL